MNEIAVLSAIIAFVIIGILVLVFNAKTSGKKEAELDTVKEVLADVEKANDVSKEISSLSGIDKRERLRKFTK